MSTQNQAIIQELREICNNCSDKRADSSANYYGNAFEARFLNTTETWQARRLIFQTAEMIEKRLVRVATDALDGVKYKWHEWLPGQVRSGDKRRCFFDPQELKAKLFEKSVNTEMLYIHRKDCMKRYIGSKFQDGQNNHPVFFRSGDSLMTVEESQASITSIMMYDNGAMASAIDGNIVLGDYRSNEGEGTMLNGVKSKFDAVDGVIKQALIQIDNAYYQTVDVTIPAIGDGCVYVGAGQQISDSFSTVAELVAYINQLADNVTGDVGVTATVITATVEESVIRLIANTVTGDAYGGNGLDLFYSAECDISECTVPLAGTVIQDKMPYSENPCGVPFQKITEDNFFDLFKGYIIKFRKDLSRLSEYGGDDYSGKDWYIAHDPDLLLEKQSAEIEKFCGCSEPEAQLDRYNALFPRFESLRCLTGTGLFFMTFAENILVLTNFEANDLANTRIWHDMDCGHIKSKNEVCIGVLLLDAAMFMTNACDSFFHKKIGPAYKPENMLHLCEEIRSDCAARIFTDVLDTDVCYTLEEDDTYTLKLSDETPDGDDAVDSVEWTVYFSDGTPTAQPLVQAQDVEIEDLTLAQKDAISLITYTVTYASGKTCTANINALEITECA